MLTPPDLAESSIIACLYESYELRIGRVTFLPIGADINTAVYRVDAADGTSSFLKLRRGDFDEVAVTLPAWLHAQGIRSVLAPIPTTTQRLWVNAHGFDWILYPFIVGANGFEAALSSAQWRLLGRSMAAVHASVLPAGLARRIPREDYAPRWRDRVRMYQQRVEISDFADPIAASFAALWRTKRDEIDAIVGRAEELGHALRQHNREFVVCHTDLHGGNVLVGANGELTIVDWDNPLLAPKERDLMFVGAGIGDVWNDAEEAALFYQGYSQDSAPTVIDPVALSYYRYERIVADFAAYGDEIFGALTSVEDRANGLEQVWGQFLPHGVVEIAHQTYQRLL
jgi:spectinomycin phosphotransferase